MKDTLKATEVNSVSEINSVLHAASSLSENSIGSAFKMQSQSDRIPLALRPNPGPGHHPLPSGLLASSCLCFPTVNSPHWFKTSDGARHFSAANLRMVSISIRVEAAVSRVPCWPLVICPPRGLSGLLSWHSPLSHAAATLASWLTLNTPDTALPGPGAYAFIPLSVTFSPVHGAHLASEPLHTCRLLCGGGGACPAPYLKLNHYPQLA